MQSANYKLSHNYGTLRFWDYTDLNGMDFKQHKKAGPEGPAFGAR